MRGRRRHKKVPLNVGFRRRYAKSKHVLLDELKVCPLAGRRPKNSAVFFGSLLNSKFHNQLLSYALDKELGAVNEGDGKASVFAWLKMRYAFAGNLLRDCVDVQN
jgi:hypothetical protein